MMMMLLISVYAWYDIIWCRYKKIKEAKDISSKSAEDKRAIFGASASSSTATVATTDDGGTVVVDVFQSIKYSLSMTADDAADKDDEDDKTDRASKKRKKESKKKKKEKRKREE